MAGSINRVGALEIRAERVGSDSSYGRIVEAIRRAQSSQAPVQRLADRFAAYLVYLALAGAAVTFAVTRDWTSTISVVVVAGACGIAAGTPLAVLAAIARVARSGAFGGRDYVPLNERGRVLLQWLDRSCCCQWFLGNSANARKGHVQLFPDLGPLPVSQPK